MRSANLLALVFACGCATADDPGADVSGRDSGRADAPAIDSGTPSDTDDTPPSDSATSMDSTPSDSTMTDTVAAGKCGDGRIDSGEVCDDGNTDGGDGCSADCTSVECTGSHTYEDPTTHHCYTRSTDVVSRSSAEAKCEASGGYLARFQTSAERTAAVPSMFLGGTDKVWIGLQKVSGAWTWDDGTAAADLPWASGEPSGDGDCVEWRAGDSMNDLPCSGKSRDYVCEREPKGSK